MQRYQRQMLLKEVGEEGQKKLNQSKVLVIGAGGLGSPILLYLAAAGVGHIAIADFDNVALHNLQRQILFHHSQINQNKAHSAAHNLNLLNPEVFVEVIDEGIHLQNFHEIIPLFDVIVDGSDNFTTKYLVNDACYVYEKPLVYGAILQWEGQFTVFNYPTNEGFSANLRDLFPSPPSPENSPSCNATGIIGTVAGVLGSFMANEVIKILLKLHEQVAYHQFFNVNLLNLTFQKFHYQPNPANPLHKHWNFHEYDYEFLCTKEMFPQEMVITWEQFCRIQQSGKPYLLVDVRESYEHEIENIGGINAPMGQLDENQLNKNVPIIFYCNAGQRSKFAATFWKKKGFNTYHLEKTPISF